MRNETVMESVHKKFRHHPCLPVRLPVHRQRLLVFLLQRARVQGTVEHHGLYHEVPFGVCAEEKGFGQSFAALKPAALLSRCEMKVLVDIFFQNKLVSSA